MAEQVSELNRGENTARTVTVGALSVVFLIAAAAPQNTRAVFITDGGLPKAFTATVDSDGPARRASYLSGLAGPRGPAATRSGNPPADRGTRRAEYPGVAFARGLPPVSSAGDTVADPNAIPFVQDVVADVATGSPAPEGAGQPFSPVIAQAVTGAPGFVASPGGGTPGTGGTGGTPATGGTPGTGGTGNPNTGTNNPTPVSAVPEPSTWLYLLGGFLMIGGALRRRRSGTLSVAGSR